MGWGWREKQTTPLPVILFTSQTAFSRCFWTSGAFTHLCHFSSFASEVLLISGCVQVLVELGPELIRFISATEFCREYRLFTGDTLLKACPHHALLWVFSHPASASDLVCSCRLNKSLQWAQCNDTSLQSNFSAFWILKSFELLLVMCVTLDISTTYFA